MGISGPKGPQKANLLEAPKSQGRKAKGALKKAFGRIISIDTEGGLPSISRGIAIQKKRSGLPISSRLWTKKPEDPIAGLLRKKVKKLSYFSSKRIGQKEALGRWLSIVSKKPLAELVLCQTLSKCEKALNQENLSKDKLIKLAEAVSMADKNLAVFPRIVSSQFVNHLMEMKKRNQIQVEEQMKLRNAMERSPRETEYASEDEKLQIEQRIKNESEGIKSRCDRIHLDENQQIHDAFIRESMSEENHEDWKLSDELNVLLEKIKGLPDASSVDPECVDSLRCLISKALTNTTESIISQGRTMPDDLAGKELTVDIKNDYLYSNAGFHVKDIRLLERFNYEESTQLSSVMGAIIAPAIHDSFRGKSVANSLAKRNKYTLQLAKNARISYLLGMSRGELKRLPEIIGGPAWLRADVRQLMDILAQHPELEMVKNIQLKVKE